MVTLFACIFFGVGGLPLLFQPKYINLYKRMALGLLNLVLTCTVALFTRI